MIGEPKEKGKSKKKATIFGTEVEDAEKPIKRKNKVNKAVKASKKKTTKLDDKKCGSIIKISE